MPNGPLKISKFFTGPSATNIFINLLPIIIFCEQRVIFSKLLTFLSQFPQINRGRTYKANCFSLK